MVRAVGSGHTSLRSQACLLSGAGRKEGVRPGCHSLSSFPLSPKKSTIQSNIFYDPLKLIFCTDTP